MLRGLFVIQNFIVELEYHNHSWHNHMRNTALKLLLLTGILFSCTEKEKQTNAANTETVQTQPDNKAMNLQEAAAVLDGSWIAKEYLDNLKKYKAVYENPEVKTTMFGMSFIKDSLATGSTLLFGFSQHEINYSWPVYWNDKTGKFQYDPKQDIGDKPLGDFTLNILKDSLLELNFTKTGKKELYRKADIETELNSLIAGTYTDKATGKIVTFTKDGKVQGIPGYVQYYVQFDEYEEYAVPFDGVTMYANTTDEAGKPFHFKIKNNTLTLYNVDEHEVEKYVEYTYTIGKEAYVLTRK